MTDQPRDRLGRFIPDVAARRSEGREQHGKSGTVVGLV